MYLRRRRVPRTKRRLRRKGAALKGRVPRPLPLYSQKKVYAFKRTCELYPYHLVDGSWAKQTANVVTSDATSPNYQDGIFKFALQDLPNYTDFTNLYENFRITGVRVQFIPMIGTSSDTATSTAYTIMEPMALCIDRGANDQIGSNVSFTQLLENQDCKLRSSFKPFSIYIAYPKAHTPADGVSQTVLTSPWLDTEVNGQVVDHHGLKFAFQTAVPAGRHTTFRVYATYYIKCRAPQ